MARSRKQTKEEIQRSATYLTEVVARHRVTGESHVKTMPINQYYSIVDRAKASCSKWDYQAFQIGFRQGR